MVPHQQQQVFSQITFDKQIQVKYTSDTPTAPWTQIWGLDTNPTIQLFIWKCSHGILPTNAKITSILSYIDPLWTYCKNGGEDITHVLLSFPAATDVWRKLFGQNHNLFTQYNNFHDWLNNWFQADNNMASWNETFATTCWFIWKARCDWVFRKLTPTACATAMNITQHLCSHTRIHHKPGHILNNLYYRKNNSNSPSGNYSPHNHTLINLESLLAYTLILQIFTKLLVMPNLILTTLLLPCLSQVIVWASETSKTIPMESAEPSEPAEELN